LSPPLSPPRLLSVEAALAQVRPDQFTWEQSAAATAVFFAMLTFTGLLIYVAVKNGFCTRCTPEKPSVSASSATPAGVSMTSSQASNKVLEVKIDGKPVQLRANLSDAI
jgi:hypothetical protein